MDNSKHTPHHLPLEAEPADAGPPNGPAVAAEWVEPAEPAEPEPAVLPARRFIANLADL